jgi:hypothetical protein
MTESRTQGDTERNTNTNAERVPFHTGESGVWPPCESINSR